MNTQVTIKHLPQNQTPREIVPRACLVCLEVYLTGSDMFEQYFLAPDVNTWGFVPRADQNPLLRELAGQWTHGPLEAMHYSTAERATEVARQFMENYANEIYFSEAVQALRQYTAEGKRFSLTVVREEITVTPLFQITKLF